MGDFLARIFQKKATNDENRAILREAMWGKPRPHHKENKVDEVKPDIPVQIEQEPSRTQSKAQHSGKSNIDEVISNEPKAQRPKTSKKEDLKLVQTQSGNHILARGWDGNNMAVFRVKKKM